MRARRDLRKRAYYSRLVGSSVNKWRNLTYEAFLVCCKRSRVPQLAHQNLKSLHRCLTWVQSHKLSKRSQYFLTVTSLEQLPLWKSGWTEHTFQKQGSEWGTSDWPGPAHWSTSSQISRWSLLTDTMLAVICYIATENLYVRTHTQIREIQTPSKCPKGHYPSTCPREYVRCLFIYSFEIYTLNKSPLVSTKRKINLHDGNQVLKLYHIWQIRYERDRLSTSLFLFYFYLSTLCSYKVSFNWHNFVMK